MMADRKADLTIVVGLTGILITGPTGVDKAAGTPRDETGNGWLCQPNKIA